MCCTNNQSADGITHRVLQVAKKSTLTLNVIVICMHSIATEKNAIDVRASQSPRPDDKNNLVGKPELLEIAMTLYKAY